MDGRQLYEVMSEGWAKEPLEYLATTQYAIVIRFQESFRYVSLHPDNASTFSYEFASILRDACSVFGSLGDAVVRRSDTNKRWEKPPDIEDFFNFYSQFSLDITKMFIDVENLSGPRRLQPFFHWTQNQRPGWWTAHNKLKHSEYKNAKLATLQNTTNAVAGVESVLRWATVNQRGTGLFSSWGTDWEPGQPGTRHKRLFDP